jgi:predicted nucleic acid-binding protein
MDLLRDFAGVLAPNLVCAEVARHRPTALRRRLVKVQCRTAVKQITPELTNLALAFSLHVGETETLRLMQENSDAILLTEDAAARLVAEKLGFDVHGTLGIVVRRFGGINAQSARF